MLRVLVVDDDPGTRDTYRVALGRDGYDVASADSRAAAVACLSRPEPFHAQFLDLICQMARVTTSFAGCARSGASCRRSR